MDKLTVISPLFTAPLMPASAGTGLGQAKSQEFSPDLLHNGRHTILEAGVCALVEMWNQEHSQDPRPGAPI